MKVREVFEKIGLKHIVLAAVILVVVIAIILGISSMLEKPTQKKAEEIVTNYLEAMTNRDGQKMRSMIDEKGYIIFKEYGEKKFDKKYKDVKTYIEDYLEDFNYDDINDATDDIVKKFENENGYYDYEFKEIVSIEKSTKSKNLIIVKAKIKQKTDYAINNNTIKIYLLKVKSQFKVVGAEI